MRVGVTLDEGEDDREGCVRLVERVMLDWDQDRV